MIEYNRNADIVTIIIKDTSYNQIYKKTINLNNKQEYFDAMLAIAEKYGFKPEVDFDRSVNAKEKLKEERKKEIDWLDKN